MSESTSTSRVKISYLSKQHKEFTLSANNEDLGTYSLDSVQIHPKMEKGDIVDANYVGPKLISLTYPPGMEPEGPSKEEIHEKFINEAKEKKELQWMISFIDGNRVVVSKGTEGGEKQFKLVDKASQFWKSFKSGDLIQFSYADNSPDTIKSMWKVDENGVRPDKNKNGYGSSGNVEKGNLLLATAHLASESVNNNWTEEQKTAAIEDWVRFYNAFLPEVKV